MAQLIWTEPALLDLDKIADYIALDDPVAASKPIQKNFNRVERLEIYPNSGKCPAELPRTPYREIVVPPCRVFYRTEKDQVLILHVMRSERRLRTYLLNR